MTKTMRNWAVLGALVAAASFTGCSSSGGSTDDTTNGSKSDAGSTNNNNGSGDKLEVNAALGIDVVPDLVLANEKSGANGSVTVRRGDDTDVPGTVVKLNGVTLAGWDPGTGMPVAGTFSVEQTTTTIPNAGPGKTLDLQATQNGETASVSLPCPADVTVTLNPTSAAEGDTVTASWTGKIGYKSDAAGLTKPVISIQPYNSATKTQTFINQGKPLQGTDTSVQLTVPELKQGADSWYVELHIPGDYTDSTSSTHGVGYCSVAKRVKLAKK